MKLPYYKQQTPFTCSLACLRMVLESLGIKTTEYQIAEIIKFNPRRGVSPKMIKEICDHFDVRHSFHFNSDIEELKTAIKKGFHPIVLVKPSILYNLAEIEHGHYIIIKDITDKSVIINDPDQGYGGEDKQIDLVKFTEAWENKFGLIFILEGVEG